MAPENLQTYRKRPGLDPRRALEWHSIRLTIEIQSPSYAAIAAAIACVLNSDCSAWIGYARVPGEGWHPATEQCMHQEQLLKNATINQYSSSDGVINFFCDVQARFIPLVVRYVSRHIVRACKGQGDRPIQLTTQLCVFDYPPELWAEIAGQPEPEPAPPKPEPVDWGKQ